MGYYTQTVKSEVHVKKENFQKAYEALIALNANHEKKSTDFPRATDAEILEAKNSGSNGVPDKHFPWIVWNYDQTCENLIEVLEEVGFEVEQDDDSGDITSLTYDRKSGEEKLFIETLAPFVEDGGVMVWVGEDGDMWIWMFNDGDFQESSLNDFLWP